MLAWRLQRFHLISTETWHKLNAVLVSGLIYLCNYSRSRKLTSGTKMHQHKIIFWYLKLVWNQQKNIKKTGPPTFCGLTTSLLLSELWGSAAVIVEIFLFFLKLHLSALSSCTIYTVCIDMYIRGTHVALHHVKGSVAAGLSVCVGMYLMTFRRKDV